MFGYVAFLYPFVLILPAFALYKESTLTERRIGVFLASMILLFSFLMAQSIIVKSELSGSFGRSIVDMLIASIGIMGVWLFIVAIFLLSMTLLVESSISDFLTLIKPTFTKTKIKEYKAEVEENESPSPIIEEKKQKSVKKQSSVVEEKRVLDDDTPDENPAILEPLYPEQKETK